MSDLAHQSGLPPAKRPVAIIDIGSNSVRLVAYDGLDRAPLAMFNEKASCALGNGVVTTGKLSKQGIDKALVALRRFRAMTEIMGVAPVYVIATAAARDASNGAEFLQAARHALGGMPVTLLSGAREAELSALGVISGIHHPDGVVGDLGGGSLELVDIGNGAIGKGVSLPLGGLALTDASGRSPKAAVKIVRDALATCAPLDALQNRSFFAVGGTWRALAKLHMGRRNYPLPVMHNYTMDAREAAELVDLVEGMEPGAFASMEAVSASRRPLLAYGAVVLDELLRRAKPRDVVISTSGVREGLLLEALDEETRRQDPLLVAAGKLNRLLARAPDFADDLIRWTAAFVRSAGLDESPEDRRLREAACMLSEVNWRAHPDYRGVQSYNIVSSAQLSGVDHPGRSFLALVTSLRHVGLEESIAPAIGSLMTPRQIERGRILGGAMRVAAILTAGMPGVLPRTPMTVGKAKLTLVLPPALADLMNDRLQSRVKQVAKALGRDAAVEIA